MSQKAVDMRIRLKKRNRFEKEAFFTYNKWEKILADGDPCYNPNLTLSNSDFSLRE